MTHKGREVSTLIQVEEGREHSEGKDSTGSNSEISV